jgi:hypothetical protein
LEKAEIKWLLAPATAGAELQPRLSRGCLPMGHPQAVGVHIAGDSAAGFHVTVQNFGSFWPKNDGQDIFIAELGSRLRFLKNQSFGCPI